MSDTANPEVLNHSAHTQSSSQVKQKITEDVNEKVDPSTTLTREEYQRRLARIEKLAIALDSQFKLPVADNITPI